MVTDLLPINASGYERALSKNTGRRIESIPVPIRDLFNPDKCPLKFLPWLAWTFSVDLWDESWSESEKRAVIKASIKIHRKKGTPGAVEYYLSCFGVCAKISEWFEYGGEPYKFKVVVDGLIQNYQPIIDAISVSKNTRSHLDVIRVCPADSSGFILVRGMSSFNKFDAKPPVKANVSGIFCMKGIAALPVEISVGGLS